MLRIKKLIALIIVALAMFSLFSAERPTFALVLSGGGARGIAHIAVLEELEKRGIVPDLVVGTSIGALVGGFYSAGYTASELESLIIDTDIMALMMRFNNESGRISILSPDSNIEDNILALDFSNSGIGTNSGVLSDQELGSFLRRNLVKALPVDHFDNLSIPFRAIGIDAVTGEEIVFEDGSLFTAMRASMSLPVLFAPVKIDDGLYVMDGGMANNLPVDVARELGADYVLAVDVNDALNQNNYGMNEHMDTFSGSINAFTTVISITNSIPQYEIADWVLVPNVNDYSTIEFNSKLEILEKGRENVAANQDVFDELEKALEGREENRVTLYKDRPSYTIEVVDAAGLKSFEKELNKFVGRALEKYTMEEFELLLEKIVEYEGLKNISYVINGSTITLKPEYYPASTGVATVGFIGEAGIKYSGAYNTYFAYSPLISLGAGMHLYDGIDLTLGVILNESFSFETRATKEIFKSGYLFSGFDLRYLNLAYNTSGLVYGNSSKNDFGFALLSGLSYRVDERLSVNGAIGYEYTHLARVLNHKDFLSSAYESPSDDHYIYIKAASKFETQGSDSPFAHGFDISASASLGLDWSFDEEAETKDGLGLGYAISLGFEYVFGYEDFINLIDLQFNSTRRYPKLKDAYNITKFGINSPDYFYAFTGARSAIGNSIIHYEAGPFVEFFMSPLEKNSDYYKISISNSPFSTLDAFALGLKGGLGIDTDFGCLYAELYVSFMDSFRTSFMVGIR